MNLCIKNILLAFLLAFLLGASACKKEPGGQSQSSIRDSIIGTYNCIEHYYTSNGYLWDTFLTPVTIIVSKNLSDNSSITISQVSAGNPDIFYSVNATGSFDSIANKISTYQYFEPPFGWGGGAHFFEQNDSIYIWAEPFETRAYGAQIIFFTGHK